MKREVLITGIGITSPFGEDKNIFWESLLQKKTCFKTAQINISPFSDIIAGHIENGNIKSDDPQLLRANKICQISFITAQSAFLDSGLNLLTIDPFRIGISWGTCIGHPVINQFGDMLNPQSSQYIYHHAPAGLIAIKNKIKGPSLTFTNGETSGNNAVGWAMRQILWDKTDIMLAGAGDILSRFNFLHYIFKEKLALQNGSQYTCQPFDKNRKGTVLSEGFAFLILEEKKHALKRKAKIYGQLVDFKNYYNPPNSLKLAINNILKNYKDKNCAKVIFASANGSNEDNEELNNLEELFGGNSCIPITSIKGNLGETQAASGIFSFISSLFALETGIIPPILGLQKPEKNGNLNLVMEKPLSCGLNTALSYQKSFWGDAAVLLARKIT
jgi:3-oxoacyl-(acyl-carrier-protein) synthase